MQYDNEVKSDLRILGDSEDYSQGTGYNDLDLENHYSAS